MKSNLTPLSYDRDAVSGSILHIGVGNFHRAHQEFFTNELLNLAGNRTWAITGAMLLPSDRPVYDALKSQDCLYTLTEYGRDGHSVCREIGSLCDVVFGPDDPQAVIDLIGNCGTRIISLTITEGGYNIDPATGNFDFDNAAVSADLTADVPTTVFGYMACGLNMRRHRGCGPVTVLSCDNLRHNGDTARRAFMAFFEAFDPELAEWAGKNVTFPNCMVDRITPATTPADVERLNKQNGTRDAAPVYCEDYIQWVIEDVFAAGRPSWQRVGVDFTDDVEPYENMKISLLNASHTMLAYPAILAGYRRVDHAIHDERIERLVRQFMDEDMTPYVDTPDGVDLGKYKDTVIERFANAAVSDRVERLCADGLSKFPTFVTPKLIAMLRDGKDTHRLAFLLAAYRHYLKHGRDDDGAELTVNEPTMTDTDRELIASDDPLDFLALAAFAGAPLRESPDFRMQYLNYTDSIARLGTLKTLETVV